MLSKFLACKYMINKHNSEYSTHMILQNIQDLKTEVYA